MTASLPTRSAGSPAVRHRLERVLNDGALALLISVGHRTGLFDVLSSLPPCNAATIARSAGLNKNYVSAWLAAMVSGGIIEHHPVTDAYSLQAEYARWLSRKAGDDSLAVATQWLPLLGSIEEDLLVTFVHGKSLPRAATTRFRALDWEERELVLASRLLDNVLNLVPGLVTWLGEGLNVLEIGSGNGAVLRRLATRFPQSRFLGLDIAAEAVATAVVASVTLPLDNLRYQRGDLKLISARAVDLVLALDSLVPNADPLAQLQAISAALRPGGTVLLRMADLFPVDLSPGPSANPLAVYGFARSLAREPGGCPETPSLLNPADLPRLMEQAGLVECRMVRIPGDGFWVYAVGRSPGLQPTPVS